MIAAVLAVPVFLFFSKNLAAQSADFNTAKSLEIQYNILKELSNGFVDSVNLEKLVNTGIDAMLGSLDPYTEYIPEEDEQNLALLTTATYGGIGALIKKLDTTGVIISQPYAGSPAVKYGLEPGDVILYQGTQIVLFYGSNTFSYTRLGRIEGLALQQLEDFLCAGSGSVSVTLSLGR